MPPEAIVVFAVAVSSLFQQNVSQEKTKYTIEKYLSLVWKTHLSHTLHSLTSLISEWQ
jgi:hypothetical protein